MSVYLPAVCLCVLAASSARAATIVVPAGGDFQAALNQAQPGDVITLAPNATYVGNFVLPNKGATSDYITIRSAAPDGSLPPAGVRMTPGYAAFLPKIKSPNDSSALRTATAAHHWKLVFLEFQANVQGYGDIIALGAGDSTQTQLSQVPYALILDRLYVHGDVVMGQKRGIALHSRDTDVINSWVSECKAVGQEAQAISGFNGPGTYLIENNHLEGATQNFLIGGADPTIPNLVTSNITFRYNHLTKPLAWRDAIIATPTGVAAAGAPDPGSLPAGTYSYKVQARGAAGQTNTAYSRASAEVPATVGAGTTGSVAISWNAVAGAQDYVVYGRTSGGQNINWTTTSTRFTDTGAAGTSGTPASATTWLVKNIFELKNAQDVRVEGNVFEHNWIAGQPGYAILFTPRNQGGSAPWVVVQRVTFQHNLVRHTAGGVNILGTDNVSPSQRTNQIEIVNNLFDDLTAAWGANSRVFKIGDGPDAVTINHNTIFTTDTTIVDFYGAPTTHFKYTNNMSPHNSYGINGTNSSYGLAAIGQYAPGSTVCDNVLAGGLASRYPGCNYFPTTSEWLAGFVEYAGGNYHLRPESVIKWPSSDGADLGAGIDTIDADSAIAISGDKRGGIIITPASLPNGVLNQPYEQQLTCSGAATSCDWRLANTSRLPAGIGFDPATATVSGTPTALEPGTVDVEASDPTNPGKSTPAYFTITIDAPELALNVPTPPAGVVGVPYTLTPTVAGAVGSTVFVVQSGDVLPDGITIHSVSGVIDGVPTQRGTWTAVVQVTDSLARVTRSERLTFTIAAAPMVILDSVLPTGQYKTMYSAILHATGGTGSVTWSPDGGTPPTGLVINPSGTISGVPESAGTFVFSVTATDTAGVSAHAPLSLTIAPPTFTISLPAVLPGTVGQAYQLTATATGNLGTVTWSIALGNLPDGLTIGSSSGAITGTPTTAGVSSSVIQATDSFDPTNRVGTAGITMTVAAPARPSSSDIVLYAADATAIAGAWSLVDDATAAGGRRIANPNADAAKLGAALASPKNYFELTFQAEAGVAYHLWMRGKAEKNYWGNDSVYAQFSGSVDESGAPIHRIGSIAGMSVSIEEATSAGLSGWGWADDSYGGIGSPIYFATTGPQTIRVQQREDGVSLDQIVLGAAKYSTIAPGVTKNDATILERAGGTFRNIVLYTVEAALKGAWSLIDDPTAAGGRRATNPDATAAKLVAPLPSPTNSFELAFTAEAGIPYHLWLRGKAENNYWGNDSVYVQFSGSVDANRSPMTRIGSTTAAAVSIEEGTGAGLSEWGWADNSYGGSGTAIYFASTGPQTIRVQVREDGVSLDQIVLSADRYLTDRPGATKNDATIVQR